VRKRKGGKEEERREKDRLVERRENSE